jgi:protein-S-isoprenylcysteine O-methyltransferase Ste14
MNSLTVRASGGMVFLLGVMTLLTFLPAGTLDFWQGRLFLAVFGASVIAISAYLLVRDPGLVERRMHAGPVAESRSTQKIIQAVTGLCFVGMLIVGGLDRRFGWSQVPAAVVVLANAIVPVSFGIIYLVFRENSFAGSTIQVAEQQRVITTGLYAHVRHPMYAGALPMLIAMPVALGSWWGLLLLIPMCAGLIARIFDEERVLSAELPGYDAYRRTVPWRLIPMVW